MRDTIGTIKKLKHLEPNRAYFEYSKQRLLFKIRTTQPSYLSSFNITMVAGIFAVAILIFHQPPQSPSFLSLNNKDLTQELNHINLKTKIEETKTQDSKNKAVDRAIQNLALTGSAPSQYQTQIREQTETGDTINTLLNELL